jgi:caspase domain-containing protein
MASMPAASPAVLTGTARLTPYAAVTMWCSSPSSAAIGRRLGAVLLSIAACLFLPAAAAAQTAERVALVVGNGAYQHLPRLDNPPADAELMAATLKGLGFTLIGGKAQVDLDKSSFERAIREFGAKLIDGSVGLFYYAGHGVQVQGGNYLIPISANPTSAADVDYELIDAELVLKQMRNAGSKLNFVILDACRNNPFGGRGLRDSGGGLAQMQAPSGTLISYATQPGNVALDGTNGHSPYTQALAEAMQKPGIDVFKTFNEVAVEVDRKTLHRQQPWQSSSPISGDFYFVAPAVPPPPPEPPQAAAEAQRNSAMQLDAEIAFVRAIPPNGGAAYWEEYLHLYPEGRYAGLARNRLADLKSPQRDATPAVPPVTAPPTASPPVQAPPAEPPPTPPPPPVVAMAPPPPPQPSCGNSDAQIVRPIMLLYDAVNRKDIELYSQQLAADLAYYNQNSHQTQNREQKIESKRRRFERIDKFNLTMDRKPEIVSKSADSAEVEVRYSMTYIAQGQPLTQNGILEKYTLTCNPSGRWLIKANIDEISAAGPAHR